MQARGWQGGQGAADSQASSSSSSSSHGSSSSSSSSSGSGFVWESEQLILVTLAEEPLLGLGAPLSCCIVLGCLSMYSLLTALRPAGIRRESSNSNSNSSSSRGSSRRDSGSSSSSSSREGSVGNRSSTDQ
ncbi:hypothetical protein Emed_000597 [Eimeria media]